MAPPRITKVLFLGSGPYRVSQETRGSLFAHSSLSYLREKKIPYVVLDDDAAAPLLDYAAPEGCLACSFDEQSLADAVFTEAPSQVWPFCTGKENQALLVRVLTRDRMTHLLPGGPGAYGAGCDWKMFRELAEAAGVDVPYGRVATSVEESAAIAGEVGFPVFLSASEPRGGGGARIAYNHEELAAHMGRLLGWSLDGRVLVVRVHERHPQCEAHLLRDLSGKSRILGFVDVLAPLGVHIGNAATVFPAESLSRKTRESVGRAASALAKKTGLVGYGVFHFGIREDGSAYAVGMRAGVTSTSYIVSVGLRFDIGYAATALAFGQSLRSVAKARKAPGRAAVSVPHFDNDLFPGAADTLGPHKISTGMGTGVAKKFAPAFLAAYRSANEDARPLIAEALASDRRRDVLPFLAAPRVTFISDVASAIVKGHGLEEIASASGIGKTYVEGIAALVHAYQGLKRPAKAGVSHTAARTALQLGFTRAEVASATGRKVQPVGSGRSRARGSAPKRGKGALVIVGPPARAVGCVDESDVIMRSFAVSYAADGHPIVLAGWRSRQPLDLFLRADRVIWGDPADALAAAFSEGCISGVYVDQRNADWDELARQAASAGSAVVGADPGLITAINDRKALAAALSRAGLMLKESEEASTVEQARRVAGAYGYPVLARQKGAAHVFVVAYDAGQLDAFLAEASGTIVVERFLEDLVETAAVVLADGKDARTVAVVEILEEPGISSIDRAGALPPFSITPHSRDSLASRAQALIADMGGKGTVTLRLGMRYEVPYFLSATVGASREVPYVSAALRRDVPSAAARIFAGSELAQVWPDSPPSPGPAYIRQPVFSFGRFPGADTVLGTRPRSTGDVMGVGTNFALAYAAARRATGRSLPLSGTVFLSLRDRDKRVGMLIGRQLAELGFRIVATEGTARALSNAGVDARVVYRVSEGRPNIVDLIKNREITMVIYTPSGRAPRQDEVQIRTVAWGLGIPVITAAGEALAALGAIEAVKKE